MFVSHFTAPAFSADFWKTCTRGASRCDNAQAGMEAGASSTRYSPQQHGTHGDFCQGPDFPRYKEEVQANLSFLADYCRRQQLADAAAIAANLQLFFNHRFEDPHYFSTRAEIVDSIGKQSLDQFCWMIRHENIDQDAKNAAIRDLAMGMTQCADGAVSNLVCAARSLSKTAGGLRSWLWTIKEDVARSVLQHVAAEWFAWRQDYAGNEIHYVNTARSIVAGRYGLENDPDGIKMPEAQDSRFLSDCNAQLKSALTPDRLSLIMAETCQARFNSQVAAAIEHASGRWTTRIQQVCDDTLREIGDAFGLACDDELRFDPQDQAWKPREVDLRLKSFLKLEESGDTATYVLRSDPCLIALDLLHSMAGLGLLHDAEIPQIENEWVVADDARAALFTYGKLAWVARGCGPDAFKMPLWANKELDIESVTAQELLDMHAGQPEDAPAPTEAAIAVAIRATDAVQLPRMPARWLCSIDLLEQVLRRLDKPAAVGYLARNAADLAIEFEDRKRDAVLGSVVVLGLGKAIPRLVEHWLPEPAKRVDMVYRLLRREAMPAFHQAMLQDDAIAAVRAWYEPLRESGLLALAAPKIAALLNHKDQGSSAFAWALSRGRTASVQAFFLLLEDILADREMQSHMKDALPNLLLTTDSLHKPAAFYAMAMGHMPSLKAFYAGVLALLRGPGLNGPIRGPLLKALPNLLAGKLLSDYSGLSYALQGGRTEVIDALHDVLKDLLNDPAVGAHLHAALPDMLATEDRKGETGVSIARKRGHDAALAAFSALLADPVIQAHIGQPLPDQLAGEAEKA